jgi:hypothetical protein
MFPFRLSKYGEFCFSKFIIQLCVTESGLTWNLNHTHFHNTLYHDFKIPIPSPKHSVINEQKHFYYLYVFVPDSLFRK